MFSLSLSNVTKTVSAAKLTINQEEGASSVTVTLNLIPLQGWERVWGATILKTSGADRGQRVSQQTLFESFPPCHLWQSKAAAIFQKATRLHCKDGAVGHTGDFLGNVTHCPLQLPSYQQVSLALLTNKYPNPSLESLDYPYLI